MNRKFFRYMHFYNYILLTVIAIFSLSLCRCDDATILSYGSYSATNDGVLTTQVFGTVSLPLIVGSEHRVFLHENDTNTDQEVVHILVSDVYDRLHLANERYCGDFHWHTTVKCTCPLEWQWITHQYTAKYKEQWSPKYPYYFLSRGTGTAEGCAISFKPSDYTTKNDIFIAPRFHVRRINGVSRSVTIVATDRQANATERIMWDSQFTRNIEFGRFDLNLVGTLGSTPSWMIGKSLVTDMWTGHTKVFEIPEFSTAGVDSLCPAWYSNGNFFFSNDTFAKNVDTYLTSSNPCNVAISHPYAHAPSVYFENTVDLIQDHKINIRLVDGQHLNKASLKHPSVTIPINSYFIPVRHLGEMEQFWLLGGYDMTGDRSLCQMRKGAVNTMGAFSWQSEFDLCDGDVAILQFVSGEDTTTPNKIIIVKNDDWVNKVTASEVCIKNWQNHNVTVKVRDCIIIASPDDTEGVTALTIERGNNILLSLEGEVDHFVYEQRDISTEFCDVYFSGNDLFISAKATDNVHALLVSDKPGIVPGQYLNLTTSCSLSTVAVTQYIGSEEVNLRLCVRDICSDFKVTVETGSRDFNFLSKLKEWGVPVTWKSGNDVVDSVLSFFKGVLANAMFGWINGFQILMGYIAVSILFYVLAYEPLRFPRSLFKNPWIKYGLHYLFAVVFSWWIIGLILTICRTIWNLCLLATPGLNVLYFLRLRWFDPILFVNDTDVRSNKSIFSFFSFSNKTKKVKQKKKKKKYSTSTQPSTRNSLGKSKLL